MIRALITSALLAGAAIYFFGVAPDVAITYALLIGLPIWFLWPLLRRTTRRDRRRQQPAPKPHPPRWPPAPTPQLTQINHHHYYYGPYYGPAPMAAQPQQHSQWPELPQHSSQQHAHDAIYNTIDPDR